MGHEIIIKLVAHVYGVYLIYILTFLYSIGVHVPENDRILALGRVTVL